MGIFFFPIRSAENDLALVERLLSTTNCGIYGAGWASANGRERAETMKATDNNFTWLHLSDLHTGMNAQDWLWPTTKHALYKDIAQLHKKLGDWELVIFFRRPNAEGKLCRV